MLLFHIGIFPPNNPMGAMIVFPADIEVTQG